MPRLRDAGRILRALLGRYRTLHLLPNWRLWMALLCVAIGGSIVWLDRQSAEPRDLVSVMDFAYADAISLGIINKEAMRDVVFDHPPTFEFIYNGGVEVRGFFKTGINEDSPPSQATFAVSFPDTVTVGSPYIVISTKEIESRGHGLKIPDLRWGGHVVSVDPPSPIISGDSLFSGGNSDLHKLIAEAKRRARHRRLIVGIPVDPIIQGFTFKIRADKMLRRLGFGREALHIWYMAPELLGLDKIRTTTGIIGSLEGPKIGTTSPDIAITPQVDLYPHIMVTLADSFSGQFEEGAPQAETSNRYSREWSTKTRPASMVEADIVDNRARFFVNMLSGLLFTGIGFFIGSMEWSRNIKGSSSSAE
jgi:hypothetical protein